MSYLMSHGESHIWPVTLRRDGRSMTAVTRSDMWWCLRDVMWRRVASRWVVGPGRGSLASVGQRLHKRPQSAFRVAGAVLAVAVGLVCGWVENLGAFVVRVAVMVIDIVDDDRGGSSRGTEGFR